MLTLSIDTTAKTCSVSVSDGALLSIFSVNNTLTHSENLLLMVDSALTAAGKKISDVEAMAVSVGPGSFTGVRIGVSAIKGLAFGKDIKIAPVSTLDALGYNAKDTDSIVVASMDARRDQTYYAVFSIENGTPVRLTEDIADVFDAACEKTLEFCKKLNKKSVIFVGDGAKMCYNTFMGKDYGDVSPRLASENIRYQNAYSVALAGEKIFSEGKAVSAELLECTYLRRPQAEEQK